MEFSNATNFNKPSLLIVEDNELDILVLKVLLDSYFNLYVVKTGVEALKALEEFVFDVVLTDINLGENCMTGVDVMKNIRGNIKTFHKKVYAITAYAENKSEMIKHGFNDVLIKPIQKEEIFKILKESALTYKTSGEFYAKHRQIYI